MTWSARNLTLTCDSPLLMGIVNLTPDSFYDGGNRSHIDEIVQYALQLISEGAHILDLGAESTRPGAKPVSAKEELGRLLPALRILIRDVRVPISIDTTKAEVARAALKAGAHIINDVSGLKTDPEMGHVISEYGAGLVLMHSRGNPQTMQSFVQYGDVAEDVVSELKESFETAKRYGISPEQIVIDPGLGFAKTAEQSLELIERLNTFQSLNRPVLIGPSRKSFIGHVTGNSAGERLLGTAASCILAFERGASIFRIHDVKEIREALSVADAILKSSKVVS